ncbi:MAG: alpha/beta hydrolase [Spirochaetes bacterium]|nr:alpha/beta hydrolase [Spirochaetota bacterium]
MMSVGLRALAAWAVLVLALGCASEGERTMAEKIDAASTNGTAAAVTASAIQSFEGSWEGNMSYLGQKIAVKLRLLQDGSGWYGRMDIPPQNAFNLPLEAIRAEGGTLQATLPGAVPLVLELKLAATVLSGKFTQGAAAGGFSATRSGSAESLRAEVAAAAAAELAAVDPSIVPEAVEIAVPGGKLYGTLSRPADGAPDTAILIIPGSGPTDRDGNSILLPGKNNSLLMLGNALVKSGNMVLRIDKRGVGKSVWPGLREEDMTIDMMAEDASAWLAYLRGRTGINRLAVIGHSEGALVALLAARTADPEALVLLTPLSADFFDTIFKQLSGASEEYLQRARFIYEELRAGRYVAEVQEDQLNLFRPSVQPYLRSLIVHQPSALLAAEDTSVLVVAGGRDLQIELADAKALAAARPGVGFLLLEEMNHVLKSVGPDVAENQASYINPGHPLAAGLVEGIAGFISGN